MIPGRYEKLPLQHSATHPQKLQAAACSCRSRREHLSDFEGISGRKNRSHYHASAIGHYRTQVLRPARSTTPPHKNVSKSSIPYRFCHSLQCPNVTELTAPPQIDGRQQCGYQCSQQTQEKVYTKIHFRFEKCP